MRLPIRTRLTLVSAGMMLVVLAVAAAALLFAFRAELARTVDEGLWSRAVSMPPDPASAVAGSPSRDEAFAQVVDAKGSVVSSPGVTGRLLPAPLLRSLSRPTFFDRDVRTVSETVPARLLAVPLPPGIGSVLVVGVDVEDQREAVARLAAVVAVGGPVLLLATTAVGWVLAGAALGPVERLRSEAAAISVSEPSRRLPEPRTGDELERLTGTLNGMLDRLHASLDRERRFVDEASHELRTPLGVLQAEVDLALKEPRSREDLERALRSIAQETERLRRLTQDLLVLARSDRGRLPVHRAEVDVSEIIGGVAAGFADRAASRGIGLRTSGTPARARVDADRLRQALENLVDNAIRHTGRGGEIELRSRRQDGRLRVVVTDTGSGFPPNLLDSAFEPFARADDDRDGDGAGLGLAIVRAVALAHGGTVSIRNRPEGGASVSLDLPA
jgi:two-component system OmpR family sensor kinase